MKDFPVFTTQYGVASLILKEIPYLHTAYITIGDSLEPAKLIEECAAFCRMCGAERVFATGHPYLDALPVYTAMWEMRCASASLGDTDAALWPVQEQTLDRWREIYNGKVKSLPNGAWMSQSDGAKMLNKGDGYFIHRDGKLLGIGRASGDIIDWVASVQAGAGAEVVRALNHAVSEDTVSVVVASVNHKAVRLYESLGFIKCREISRWAEV